MLFVTLDVLNVGATSSELQPLNIIETEVTFLVLLVKPVTFLSALQLVNWLA
jgi:hypothetical protein